LLELRLLGSFSIKSGKRNIKVPSRAGQSLLAFLVLNAGTHFRREKLAGQFWPESTEEGARDYLRHALWRVRKALQTASCDHLLQTDDLTVAFVPSKDYWLDTAALLRAGESRSADSLMKALAVYRGELLPGFYEDWVVLEREHLQAVYEQEMGRLLGLLEESGSWPQVLEWAEKWIALGQRPEPAYRALLAAYAAQGDMSKVAGTYERCLKNLREFGVEPSEQTRQLYEDIKSGKAPPPEARRESLGKRAISTNIPVPLTSFVGRERELQEIAKLLHSSRLLTLTGTGGVGKTRLAIQTANDALKRFKDGVFWVGLAGLSDPKLIPNEIAKSLQIREIASEDLMQTLIRHLGSKEVLLVLDNCEHLIKACAQHSEQLLAACPNLRILATSVEAMGLFNEKAWQVPSLPLPQGTGAIPLNELLEFEAIRLFSERAANASPDFALNEDNGSSVVKIGQRLDGIPLAIELAAARTKVLSVQEIAARLDDRFNLLTAGSRTAIPRHQTLRATIDWSHDLLSSPEQVLFRRLGVFSGGFTLEAAEAICSEGIGTSAILDLLGGLAARSLVVVDAAAEGQDTRYHLLETIRHYALEKMMSAGDAPVTREQHAEFYARLAEASEPHVYGRDSVAWFERLEREIDNLRAAIEWSTASGRVNLALRILGSAVYFWFVRVLRVSEWSDHVEQALKRSEGGNRSLERAKVLNAMGFMYWAEIYPVMSQAYLKEALDIGKELGDPLTIATALQNVGLVDGIRGNFEEARQNLEQSTGIYKDMGASGNAGRALSLLFLGDLALKVGDAERARSVYEETCAILRKHGDLNFLAYTLRRLGQLAWSAGDFQRAQSLCKESLELNEEVGDLRAMCACLAGFAAIAAAQGAHERAAVLAASVEAQLASLGVGLLVTDRTEFDGTLSRLQEALPEKELAGLQKKGRSMSVEEAIDLGLQTDG
jgi:predicted ATPase/DNA-binding SARP family transcriptional activator